MAENKKSFLLYCDLLQVVRKLPKDTQADLFLHILEYVNDLNPTITDNILLEIAFEPIKLQLKRDLVKYECIKEKNSINARKRWDAKNATASIGMRADAKNADTDNDNDNDTDNDTVTDNVIILNKNGFFLNSLSKEIQLSELDIGKSQQYVKLKTKIDIDAKIVVDFWEAFKIENFEKKEWKNSYEDLISHFRNSLKIQIEKNETHQRNNVNVKLGTSDARLAALKKW